MVSLALFISRDPTDELSFWSSAPSDFYSVALFHSYFLLLSFEFYSFFLCLSSSINCFLVGIRTKTSWKGDRNWSGVGSEPLGFYVFSSIKPSPQSESFAQCSKRTDEFSGTPRREWQEPELCKYFTMSFPRKEIFHFSKSNWFSPPLILRIDEMNKYSLLLTGKTLKLLVSLSVLYRNPIGSFQPISTSCCTCLRPGNRMSWTSSKGPGDPWMKAFWADWLIL